MCWRSTTARLAIAAWMTAAGTTAADEGMWPLNRLPLEYLQKTYGFEPTADWTEHVQKSCLKFGRGGSASFVSADGLVMTNHHVGTGAIRNVSDSTHDYIRDGFYAARRQREIKCPNLRLKQLLTIEDVTARVQAAATPGMPPAEARQAREHVIAEIEQQAQHGSHGAAEVVKLYHGARYHLYVYKVYDDVRLVMAPERAIAFLGGDVDNFEYPRFNLDVCFFRAYEDGRPAQTPHFLQWSPGGTAEGELVFMAGNPARTRRMYTLEHLQFLRDVELPLLLNIYNQREVALGQFVQRSREHTRIGRDPLFGTQNGRKAFGGILEGLLDDAIVQGKQTADRVLKEFARSAGQLEVGDLNSDPWLGLSRALNELSTYHAPYFLLENRRSSAGRLLDIARKLVRAAIESEKPNAQRLSGYRDADIAALQSDLFSEAPIYPDLERLLLNDALTRLARVLGGSHPIVKAALAGQPPAIRARAAVDGTRLADVAYRRQLYEGGMSAIRSGDGPMIRLAVALESAGRRLLERYQQEHEGIETACYARIAEVAFQKYGERIYPDATGTLRLSIGTVRGWQEGARAIPAFTNMGGAFEHAERHDHAEPFRLPESWTVRKDHLKLDTPLNFVSTNDIIGGNSGSPVFNHDAQVVGIVFDINIHSLIWDIQFDQRRGRAVSVDARGIIEALRSVYQADALVNELLGAAGSR